MTFAVPQTLWFFAGIPLLLAFLWWAEGRRRAALERFAQADMIDNLTPTYNPRSVWYRGAVLVLAYSLLVVAAARPQWGYEERRVVSRGVDMLLALDVSNSMRATDIKPSRLDRAKNLLQEFVWQARGNRIGVLAFAGATAVVCPLTVDQRMVNSVISGLSPDSIGSQGTNFESVLQAARRAFEVGSGGQKVLVLLSDGEDQETEWRKEMDLLKKDGVRVYAIGIGGSEGVPVPTKEGGYKQMGNGQVVSSKLNWENLAELCISTGGNAVLAKEAGRAEIAAILDDVAEITSVVQEDTVRRVYFERYPWFLAPAILLLMLESLLSNRGRRHSVTKTAAAAAAIGVIAVIAIPTSAQAFPGQDYWLARAAEKAMNAAETTRAVELYTSATQSNQKSALLRYNLGTSLLQNGQISKAKEVLEEVYDKDDPVLSNKAKFNRAIVAQREFEESLSSVEARALSAPKFDPSIRLPEEEYEKAKEKLNVKAQALRDILAKAPDDDIARFQYEMTLRQSGNLELIKPTPAPTPTPGPTPTPDPSQNNQQPDPEGKQQQKNPQGQQQQQDPQGQQQNQQGEQNQQQQQQQQQQQNQKNNDSSKPEKNQNQPDKNEGEQNKPERSQDDAEKKNKDAEREKKEREGKDASPKADKPEDKKGEEPTPGQMSKSDVDRLLNSLPDEGENVLNRLTNVPYNSQTHMDRDW